MGAGELAVACAAAGLVVLFLGGAVTRTLRRPRPVPVAAVEQPPVCAPPRRRRRTCPDCGKAHRPGSKAHARAPPTP